MYIGFGSITVPRAHTVARSIVKAVLRADVRAVLVRGWSDRMGDEEESDVELPPEVYGVRAIFSLCCARRLMEGDRLTRCHMSEWIWRSCALNGLMSSVYVSV